MENPLKLLFAQLGPEPTPATRRRRFAAAVVIIALGCISAGYGMSIMMLGTNTRFFLFWFAVALFFFALGHTWYTLLNL